MTLMLADLSADRPNRRRPAVRRLCRGGSCSPIFFRTFTSDSRVVRSVFAESQYACVGDLQDVRTIVSCGANIGCTAIWFLERYPKARLIALEPDPDNFAMCQKNLAPYADRVVLVQAGLWSRPARLRVERGEYRDGLQWAFRVVECSPGEPSECDATTMDRLLKDHDIDSIDLLKVDIETAEREVFRADCTGWLKRVRNLAIELHDEECERIFREALGPFAFEESSAGELTVCRNVRFLNA